ncbi:phage portal protein [Nonomuraea sp. NPDC050786]|uniref:phage portal protein n=1 Tax=Nonomuraea sp. NPDC050786 TaxID=3154840 RepID=UPI0033D6A4DF
MNLLQWLTGQRRAYHDPDAEWSVGGNVYYGRGGSVNGEETPIAGEYLALAQRGYKGNGPVFALMSLRQLVFSEARFQFQRLRDGRPGKLFGGRDLTLLERPWTNGTTGDLLSRMIQDADLAGNAFIVRRDRETAPALREGPEMLKRLRPDWVTIIMGSDEDPDLFGDAIDGEVIAYAYHPHGRTIDEADIILPEDMAHFAPYPDPEFQVRGMSWLTPVLREIDGDQAATAHKSAFFKNGAMSTTVISLDPALDVDKVKRFRAMFEEQHKGVANAYRTMILGGGADARTLGADLRQLDFKATQGAGETRLAAAAGVPASIVGFSEGMAGSALNAGNYSSARRRFADATMRPLWRMAAAALENLLAPDPDVRLWYDDRDIPFLREDREVVAQIQATQASTIGQLIQAGYKPDQIIDALVNEDWSLLKNQHTGLYSVQLQEPVTAEAMAKAKTEQAAAGVEGAKPLAGINGQSNGRPAQTGAQA